MASSSSTTAPPWIVLSRVALVEHDAAEDRRDVSLPLADPPLVCRLTMPRTHPELTCDGDDMYPYVLAANEAGLLLYVSRDPSVGSTLGHDDQRALFVARGFLPADADAGSGARIGTAERVPDRAPPEQRFVSTVGSIGLLPVPGTGGAEYVVAELKVADRTSLFTFRPGSGFWDEQPLTCPLGSGWTPNDVIAHDGKLWWADLARGLLVCDPLANQPELRYVELPKMFDVENRGEPQKGIERRRVVRVSGGRLLFVGVSRMRDDPPEKTVVVIWTLVDDPFGKELSSQPQWKQQCMSTLETIWASDSYKASGMPEEVPVLAFVHPDKPDVVFFFLADWLFAVDVHNSAVVELVRAQGHGQCLAWAPPRSRPKGIADDAEASRHKLIKIVDVWADGVNEAFSELQQMLSTGQKWAIGMDTEYCYSDAYKPAWRRPESAEEHYTWAHRYVDNGDLVQVGLAVANPTLALASNKVYQFNIQFDATTRIPNSQGVYFLRQTAGLKLEDHASKGIPAAQFIDKLMASGLLSNSNITWLTYQGYPDYGYLLAGVNGVPTLPPDRLDYLAAVKHLFPESFDVRVFHVLGIYCKALEGEGGLDDLAELLKVKRLGKAHHAGSDALLALRCFEKIFSLQAPFVLIRTFSNFVYGVADVSNDPAMVDDKMAYVEVKSSNLQEQKKIFKGLFPGFGFVSVDVQQGSSICGEMLLEVYDAARVKVAEAKDFKVQVAITDHCGWVGLEKIWIFHIGEAEDCISPSTFAELLTDCKLIGNSAITWVASENGAAFLYLVNLLTVASLPPSRYAFLRLCSGFFPEFQVVPVDVSSEVDATDARPMTVKMLRGLLFNKANGLNVERSKMWRI